MVMNVLFHISLYMYATYSLLVQHEHTFSEELFCSDIRFRHPKAIFSLLEICDILRLIASWIF